MAENTQSWNTLFEEPDIPAEPEKSETESTVPKPITKEAPKEHITEDRMLFIACKRFGGSRCVLSCAHFDRYRGCRRTCKSLEKFLETFEGLEEKVAAQYKGKDSYMPSKQSCKGLPVLSPYKCSVCGFNAKSERGLKAHITRSHKKE